MPKKMTKSLYRKNRGGPGNPFIFLTQPKIATAFWRNVMSEFDTCGKSEVDSIWFIYDELMMKDSVAAEAFYEENYEMFMGG